MNISHNFRQSAENRGQVVAMPLCSGSAYNLDLVKAKWRQHHRSSHTEETEQTATFWDTAFSTQTIQNTFPCMSCFPSGLLKKKKKVMTQRTKVALIVFSGLEEPQLPIQTPWTLFNSIEAPMTSQRKKKTPSHSNSHFICDCQICTIKIDR